MATTLVGRDTELATLVSLIRRRRPGAVVTGPPGIGRSTLAGCVVDVAVGDGADVVHLRATTSAGAIALGALAPAFLTDTDAPVPLEHAVRDAIAERGANGRLVLVVDDAHVLDGASSRVLARVVDDGAATIIATAADDRIDGPLLTHGDLELVALGQMELADVEALLHALGADVADAESWWRRSGGNPTAIGRMLAAGTDGLPVADVLDRLLAAVSTPARYLLDVIALTEPVPARIVDELAPTGTEPAELVAELLSSRLIEPTGDGGRDLHFLHASDADVVRDMMPPLRRRAVVRAAVRAIRRLDTPTTTEARVRLVALARQAGEPVAPDELVTAARAARGGNDAALALDLARAAAEATGAVDDLTRWADLAYERNDRDGLDAALAGLRRHADGDDSARVALGATLAEWAFWRDGDPETALALLRDAAIGDRHDEMLAISARILATIGRCREAISVAEPLSRSSDERVRAQAAAALGHAWRRLGRPGRAVSVLDAALDHPSGGDAVLLVSRQVLGTIRALALLEAGRWDDAAEQALESLALAERHDDLPGRAVATLALAAVEVDRGLVRDAMTTAATALGLFEQLNQPAGVRWASAVQSLAGALSGDGARAADGFDRVRRSRHPATLLVAVESRADGWRRVERDPASAREVLASNARNLAGDDVGAALACVHELAVLGAPELAASILETVERTGLGAGGAPEVDTGPLATMRRRHVQALADDDVDALESLVGAFADAGSPRWAAECAAAASTVAARRGDQRTASRLAQRCGALTATCVGLATPGLVAARIVAAGCPPLTERELDVALLAARGCTTREIAERLDVSVRTVDKQLSNTYDKLAVRTRTALGPLLGIVPSPPAN